jgi:predicted nuclease of restriction endonuclease-like (RecB) superfamily
VGTQYPLTRRDQDFFIDLLFYHLNLRCFVVIDLKMRRLSRSSRAR